ncbi:uncharacterized protein BDZ99DRAFT_561513 [Mytilinidion resinicola]|uniref:Uncharacterized protein n=1 Tax=Mytilinidion resinicola TaxID=574789 RepID=A0A6A6YQX1_9PEZI|nr:uncharacterized protein BDZ99DRAFT_561513 [Mytilinidion resinicola]KAF2810909.1 hypothetical protein BDZ99DRAFT_561513 [Mytilinidion resinicola]
MSEVPTSSRKRKRRTKKSDRKHESNGMLVVDLVDPQKDGKTTTVELYRTPTTEKLLKIGIFTPKWTPDNHLTLPMSPIAFPGVMSCLKYGKLPNRLYEVDDPAEFDESDPDAEFKSNLERLFVDSVLVTIYKFGYAFKDTTLMRIVVDCFLQRSEHGLGPLSHSVLELRGKGLYRGGPLPKLMLPMMIFAGHKLEFKNWKQFSPSFSYLAHVMERLKDEGVSAYTVPQDTVALRNSILDGWFSWDDQKADCLAACMLVYSNRFHYADSLDFPQFSGIEDYHWIFDDFEIDTAPIYDTDSEEELGNNRASEGRPNKDTSSDSMEIDGILGSDEAANESKDVNQASHWRGAKDMRQVLELRFKDAAERSSGGKKISQETLEALPPQDEH